MSSKLTLPLDTIGCISCYRHSLLYSSTFSVSASPVICLSPRVSARCVNIYLWHHIVVEIEFADRHLSSIHLVILALLGQSLVFKADKITEFSKISETLN